MNALSYDKSDSELEITPETSTTMSQIPYDTKPDAAEIVEHDSKDIVDTTAVAALIHNPKNWQNFGFWYQFFVISLTWLLFGYDVGLVGSLIGLPYFIIHYQGPPETPGIVAFTPQNINMTVTVAIVGSLVAPIIGPFMIKRLGRKGTISIAFGLFCLPSSFLQLFAPNIGALAFGRFWNFAGVTLAETTVIPYLVEIVPSRYRAISLGFSGAFNGVAQVIATVIMYFCSQIQSDMQWKIPLAIQIALPFVLFLLSFTLNESTSWLLKNGRIEEATAVQTKIRAAGRQDLVEAEIAALLAAIHHEEATAKSSRFLDIFNKENRKRTFAASLMAPMTACSGLGLTTTYGVVILIAAGVADPFKWQILSALLALLGLVSGSIVNDIIGRRPLAVGGLIAVAVFDYIAGGIGFTGIVTQEQGLALAAVSIVLAFVCQFAFSGNYALMGEIPATTLREHTISYSIFCSLGATIVSTVAFPYILGPPGMLGPKAYLICGGFMTVGAVVVYFFIPETKNRTWTEIDEMYREGVKPWKMRSYKGQAMEQVASAAQDMSVQAQAQAVRQDV